MHCFQSYHPAGCPLPRPRDIKDENILLNPITLQTKLIDFGKLSNVYLPPEYYREKKYSAFPAAVWTICCLVHCLIAGDCPFNDKTEIRDYVRLQWLDDGDDLAKEVINQCIQSDADQRLNVVSFVETSVV
ncbi:serine/threonine-protein kinase pim-2-like [Bolinopsis microptera]|uniref:serine/threonine-protein kinase pim-2-like n=1 Tax=Bolinopsis microptera TaxID=2820187 RepID=UPI00307A9782